MKAYSLSILFGLVLFGCAHTPKSSSNAASARPPSYKDAFDAWRASSLALEPAAHGDRDAQDVFFLAAYVRVSQPYMGGEDLEQMLANFKELLTKLGDDAFAAALARQRPEVRSAVLLDGDVRGFPKTRRLLKAAPKIDFPMWKVYRRNSH